MQFWVDFEYEVESGLRFVPEVRYELVKAESPDEAEDMIRRKYGHHPGFCVKNVRPYSE
jgi:hypothetical protein